MRTKQLYTRPRGKRGEVNGRSTKSKHILLPEDTFDELQLFKQAYEKRLGKRVTWEQMLRRWMDNVGRFDRDVYVQKGLLKIAQKNEEPTKQPTPPEG